jgi:hypothetical protein
MRPAEARFSASIKMSSSMRLVFTGLEMGWTTKISFSRTFSRMRTNKFSFVNSKASAAPSGWPR